MKSIFSPVPVKGKHHNIFDDLFNLTISDFVGSDFFLSSPAVNVVEAPDSFRIELAAPGLQKDNFELKIEKDQLVITAKQETEENTTEEKVTRREFNYSSFKRSFRLPKTVNTTAINATYENGILLVSLPKKEEAKDQPARQIEIS